LICVKRRRLLQAAAAVLAGSPWLTHAQQRVPIADMHSHYGLVTRRNAQESGFADDLRANGVALVAWKAIPDGPWLRFTPSGVEQAGEPRAGALANAFAVQFDRMKAYIDKHKLKTVLTRADVDACLAGESGIVLASEGADFLEGKLDGLEAAYEKGLRHLQFVHYIGTPVGDRQTERPSHNGLSELGKRLVEACNARGMLVDLSHCAGPAVDQALAIADAPLVWSHGWVDSESGRWNDPYGFLSRRLSLEHAKKIAAKGGVVGLWGLGLPRYFPRWPVSQRDQAGYARELAKLVDKLGADHVAMGTDLEGLGPNWVVDTYAHARTVVEALQAAKLPASTVEKVAFANYARVLKAALKA
jgi:membrane dipeptidase